MSGTVAKGDFIEIDYVGRVKETGKLFDLTSEELARKEGVYDEKTSYGPRTVIVGAGHLIKGLEDSLVGAEVGGKLTVELPPERAFGQRDNGRTKLVPMREFTRKRVAPYPGMSVLIDNETGVVRSVSSGRVMVDFNHPLAGRTLMYEVEVHKKVTAEEERVRAILGINLDMPTGEFGVHVSKDEVVITVPEQPSVFPRSYKQKIAGEIMEHLGKGTVQFQDVFRRAGG